MRVYRSGIRQNPLRTNGILANSTTAGKSQTTARLKLQGMLRPGPEVSWSGSRADHVFDRRSPFIGETCYGPGFGDPRSWQLAG